MGIKELILIFIVVSLSQLNLISQLDSLHDFNSEGYAIVEKDNKYGIVDIDNEMLIPLKYDSIIDIHAYPLIGVVNSKKIGIFDIEKKKEKIAPKYDYLFQTFFISDTLNVRNFIVQINDKFGIIDKRGHDIIEPQYDAISSWVEYGPNGHYVLKNSKYGLLKHNGETLIPVKYDNIYYTSDEFIEVRNNDKVGVLNIKNEILIPIKYESIYIDFNFWDDYQNGSIWANQNLNWREFNRKGQETGKILSNEEFIQEFGDFANSESGFKYIEDCMIFPRKLY